MIADTCGHYCYCSTTAMFGFGSHAGSTVSSSSTYKTSVATSLFPLLQWRVISLLLLISHIFYWMDGFEVSSKACTRFDQITNFIIYENSTQQKNFLLWMLLEQDADYRTVFVKGTICPLCKSEGVMPRFRVYQVALAFQSLQVEVTAFYVPQDKCI